MKAVVATLVLLAGLGFGGTSSADDLNGSGLAAGQQELSQAQDSHQSIRFIAVSHVTVIRILPDQVREQTHQKWIVRLDNGRTVMAVFNSTISDPVQYQVGDVMNLGGQYIWDASGGLLHWLHDDPRGERPNGYVEVNGQHYGHVNPDAIAAGE